ncbi:heavy metal-associated isoprenylated plant protein 3-like isoform X2 [Chenopodium quinoa]|uniref:heavy metal-associated isoprenylated plant protein 3-like isoform X2 n=1 Tax=Chenopodium quinoa TaxID=63459 RepID=UPI000B7828FA|nr:heavy metal-associated isoprenylated plant protein 3-like isoform X2 [Chenopodium quinoa]
MSKSKVRMGRGFMCQSSASTAVGCMPDDMRSVIVPCKSNNGRIGNSARYSRLVDDSSEKERLLVKGSKRRENLLPLNDRNKVKAKGDHKSSVSDQQRKAKSLQNCSSGATHLYQVVVLRVSLHCQGCAGKVKKHLSKMEGVTSFNIDLETKRVTVMGNLSPTRVLENISKIKRAELWTC